MLDEEPEIFFVASDNQIVISKLSYALTGAFINNATIIGTLEEENDSGAEISPGFLSINFAYQTGSDGKYVGILPASYTLVPGTTYILVITITTLAGEIHTQRISRLADYDDR